MMLCVTVLLTLCIITELMLKGVSALGKRCLGPDFRPYQSALGQSHRVFKGYSKGKCYYTELRTTKVIVLRGQIEQEQNIIKD